MLNPKKKGCKFHPDAKQVYDTIISKDSQLGIIFDGLRWLIVNNLVRNAEHITGNYYKIKSTDAILKWQSKKVQLQAMPTIALLLYDDGEDVIIEGIFIGK